MATFLSIANAALVRLGEPAIEFLDDQSQLAEDADPSLSGQQRGPITFRQAVGAFDPEDFTQSTLAAIYPGVRDALLNATPWTWLQTRSRLEERPATADEASLIAAFPWPYEHRFAKPLSLIGNIRSVWDASTPGDPREVVDGWTLQGPYVFTSFTPVYADYQRDTGEPGYPSLFVKALELKLAAELSWPITQDADAQRNFERMAMLALADAQRVDAQSHPAEQIPQRAFDWVTGRLSGPFTRGPTNFRV